jgi:HK97 family phage portal protein
MGFLVRTLTRPPADAPTPSGERRSLEQLLGAAGGGGISVSEEGALKLAAVYACVRVLSETVAQLPLIIYERLERGKERAVDHPLYRLLHDQPNPLMTAFEWRETLMSHLALWGNAYCEIEMDGAGRPLALWPLRPDQMEDVRRKGDALTYLYQLPDGKRVVLRGEQVFHVRGLSPDGVWGYSPIRQFARQLVGMGLAVETFGSAFFANGARPGGVLQHPGKLGDEAYANLRESWGARHEGVSNAHRVAILEEGMTFQAIGVPPEEAQFLESMKLNRTQIASIFRVPPHMIGDLERATFSNIEQQSIEFKTYTIEPWLVRWQQAINTRLMIEGERDTFFAEFLTDALLRGDTASRYQAHAIGRQNGWLSANDIREIENMNPVDGGDVYLIPLNMVPAGEQGSGGAGETEEEEPKEEQGGGGAEEQGQDEERAVGARVALRNGVEVRKAEYDAAAARHRLQVAFLPLYEDVAGRVCRREANDIGNAAKRLLGKGKRAEFDEWLERFLVEDEAFTRKAYAPVMRSYAAQIEALAERETGKTAAGSVEGFADAYLDEAARRHVNHLRTRVMRELRGSRGAGEQGREERVAGGEEEEPMTDAQIAAQIEAMLETYRENEPERMARQESVRANNALAIALYGLMQVFRKRWITFGDNCPYCDSLAGRSIDLDAFFLALGQQFLPEGAAMPLIPGQNVGHAPAHEGCDCMVVAG